MNLFVLFMIMGVKLDNLKNDFRIFKERKFKIMIIIRNNFILKRAVYLLSSITF